MFSYTVKMEKIEIIVSDGMCVWTIVKNVYDSINIFLWSK